MKLILLGVLAAALAPAQEGVFYTPYSAQIIPVQVAAQPKSFDCVADGTVVSALTGEPILRAHVYIDTGGTTSSTATDASGKWALSGLACAPGQLRAIRPGFLQNRVAPKQLTLISGSPVHDIRTELMPQSVASGKIVDDQGDPIMGAEVTALTLHVVDGKWALQAAGFGGSNDLGEYRIANLPAGRYIFCAHGFGMLGPATASTTSEPCSPGPPEGGAAGALELPAGAETKVDFSLNEVLAVHVRGTISGVPEGRGAGLAMNKRSPVSTIKINVPGVIRNNQFDFRVTPGSYTLSADYFENGKRLSARREIDVGSSDIDNLELHLETGFSVTGTVRVESQSGQTGALPQMQMTLKPSDQQTPVAPAKWGEDHQSFSWNEVTAGNYRLVITPPSPYYVKSATLAGQDFLNTDMPISQAAGPIEVVLRDDGGTIEGDVGHANGQPAAAGIILLRDTVRIATQRSQPNGHFKLQNLPPGDYTIYAWDDLNQVAYADADWMHHYAPGGMAVTVTASQSTQIKLTEQIAPPE